MPKQKSLIKYNQTVQISNSMGFMARKCWNILLSHFVKEVLSDKGRYKQDSIYNFLPSDFGYPVENIRKIDIGKQLFTHELKVLDLITDLEIKGTNQEYLKKILTDLMKTVVEYNIISDDGKPVWGAFSLLSYCEMKDGIITYEFPSVLIDKMLTSPYYTRIKLSMQCKMTNKYSLALYENCLKWFDKNEKISYSPKLTIKELKLLLIGDDQKYPEFREFNRYVLKQAIKQINEISDIRIAVKKYRRLKVITDLQFLISKHEVEKKETIKEQNNIRYETIHKDGYEFVRPIVDK